VPDTPAGVRVPALRAALLTLRFDFSGGAQDPANAVRSSLRVDSASLAMYRAVIPETRPP
jgi:hypothetical protein